MAGAGVPASIADRAAIVAALQVLCALPECARGALNASGFIAGFRPYRNCPNWGGSGMRCVVMGMIIRTSVGFVKVNIGSIGETKCEVEPAFGKLIPWSDSK